MSRARSAEWPAATVALTAAVLGAAPQGPPGPAEAAQESSALVHGAAPESSPTARRGTVVVDTLPIPYRRVHEEVDGGADSGVSPDGRWISFSHSKTGNREVYAVDTETGEVRNLTNSGEDEWEARWHPRGTHIVYTANRNGQNGVFLMDLATGEETTVHTTKEGYEDYPSFSKDGAKVSFTAGPFGAREVYTWEWATGQVRAITRGHDYVGSTNFSADGERIVYHAYYGGSYNSERADIFVVDAEGGRGVNITHNDDVWVYKAQWSHDGGWIAFSARYDSPNFNLWVMRPDGSDRTRITDVEGEDFRWADWTADGRLAWHGIVPQRGALVELNPETGVRREIAHGADFVRSLSASPDGRRLVFEMSGDVYVTDAVAGSIPLVLAEGVAPRFTEDGSAIEFLRERRTKIGRVPVGGGEVVLRERRDDASWPAARAEVVGEDRVRRSERLPAASGPHVFFAENAPNRVGYYITTVSVTERLNQRFTDGSGR